MSVRPRVLGVARQFFAFCPQVELKHFVTTGRGGGLSFCESCPFDTGSDGSTTKKLEKILREA